MPNIQDVLSLSLAGAEATKAGNLSDVEIAQILIKVALPYAKDLNFSDTAKFLGWSNVKLRKLWLRTKNDPKDPLRPPLYREPGGHLLRGGLEDLMDYRERLRAMGKLPTEARAA